MLSRLEMPLCNASIYCTSGACSLLAVNHMSQLARGPDGGAGYRARLRGSPLFARCQPGASARRRRLQASLPPVPKAPMPNQLRQVRARSLPGLDLIIIPQTLPLTTLEPISSLLIVPWYRSRCAECAECCDPWSLSRRPLLHPGARVSERRPPATYDFLYPLRSSTCSTLLPTIYFTEAHTAKIMATSLDALKVRTR